MELVAIVKRECETCQLVGPVLAELRKRGRLELWSQDDPAFPEIAGGSRDDRSLEASRVLAAGQPVLLLDSQAVCVPNGTPLSVVQTQTRVTGM